MIANRPDWTLSRQRQWGTPMAFFLHRETGELHPRTQELLEAVAQRVAEGGIEVWQSLDPKELLGDEADLYEKGKDTLDVWFDSGSTHQTVLRGSHAAESVFPADLYLEGSDQHRGWFHSSLLVSCMLNGVPPYKALLTHGFVVDGARPQDEQVARQRHRAAGGVGQARAPRSCGCGLRAATTPARSSISDEILKRVVESYRRIRNTLRFLLANVADFDIARDAVPLDRMLEIDRYALLMTEQLQQQVTDLYLRYEFHPVVSALQTFCSEDLGALLPRHPEGPPLHHPHRRQRAAQRADRAVAHHRRAAQADGADPVVHRRRGLGDLRASSHAAMRPAPSRPKCSTASRRCPTRTNFDARWTQIRERAGRRAQGTRRRSRERGDIGSSLQAEVVVSAADARLEALQSLGDDLRFVLITSAASVVQADDASAQAVAVTPSAHAKCERCWHWRADVGDRRRPSGNLRPLRQQPVR